MLQLETSKQMLPMYDVKNLAVKSANMKKMANRLYGLDKHVDIYVPDMKKDPVKCC